MIMNKRAWPFVAKIKIGVWIVGKKYKKQKMKKKIILSGPAILGYFFKVFETM